MKQVRGRLAFGREHSPVPLTLPFLCLQLHFRSDGLLVARAAGCDSAAADQVEYPGYVEGTAPKHQRPAFCATLPPLGDAAPAAFNCSHSNGAVRRLCPCEPLPAEAVAAAQQAAAAAAGGSGAAAAEMGTAAANAQEVKAAFQQALSQQAGQAGAAAVQQPNGQHQAATAATQQPDDQQQQQAAALQVIQQQPQQQNPAEVQ